MIRSLPSARAATAAPKLLACGLALIAQLAAGCGQQDATPDLSFEARPAQLQQDYPALTASIFGDAVDANEVVANVGDTEITVGELATYLSLYPTLSSAEAVQDLVDIHVGAALADTASQEQYTDARLRGRAFAWLRTHIWTNPEYNTPGEERLQQLLEEPQYRTEYETPELARVTHALFASAGDENHTPELARLAEELAQRVRDHLANLDRPVTGPDLLVAIAETYPEDDPIREELPLHTDAALLFPREYSGETTWAGLHSVVPRFAEASFTAPLNTLVGPVESYYGWHMIVVEERIPAETSDPAEVRAMMEERTIREQRGRATQAAVERRLAATRILTFEDNVRLLALSAEERLRLDADHLGERFQ